MIRNIAETRMLTSLEVVEVNPILDHANSTGKLAVELVASSWGRASCSSRPGRPIVAIAGN